ncbi:hypothetical protein NDU88_003837, partial [Pleurodeles waltl]
AAGQGPALLLRIQSMKACNVKSRIEDEFHSQDNALVQRSYNSAMRSPTLLLRLPSMTDARACADSALCISGFKNTTGWDAMRVFAIVLSQSAPAMHWFYLG